MGDESPDEIEALPPDAIEGEITEEAARQVADRAIRFLATRFSGPLPPPGVLQAYDELSPGLAGRIVSMAEREQEHRHALERGAFDEDSKLGRRGQIFALLVAAGGLIAAVILGLAGEPLAAAIIGSVDLLGLVTVFLLGPRLGGETAPVDSES